MEGYHLIPSAAEFARLRCSDNPDEYRRAANEDAAIEVWMEVIDDYPDLRKWVAHNKSVPIVVLERLAVDPDPAVRWMVACKGKISAELLDHLSRDVDESVRVRVVNNRRVTVEILRRLASDESWVVRDAVSRKLEG